MESMILTHGLTKVYGNSEIVTDVNMNVRKGEIYGFLGENGAGKSTIMKMIMNLVKPTSGTIELLGQNMGRQPYEILKRVSAIIEEPIFYKHLNVRENMELHCEYMGYHNFADIDQALKLVNLEGVQSKKITQLSLGMKQRLAIARAFVTKPELLILDEPINGLDPTGTREVRNLIQQLNEEYGVTILISSHILSEIEQVATTIGVLANHHLVKEVSMKQIHEQAGEYFEVVVDDVKKTATIMDSVLHYTRYKIMNDTSIRVYESNVVPNQLMKTLLQYDINITSMNKKGRSLEEYFLKLVKEA